MTRSKQGSFRKEQRRFRAFLVLVGVAATCIVVASLVVREVTTAPDGPFITRSADPVLFEVLLIFGGTALGSALVGILLDEYQKRFGERAGEYEAVLRREGIVGVYPSSEDPDLLLAIERAMAGARSQVVGVGLGLSVLVNRKLLGRLANRLQEEPNLKVDVVLGSPDNAGVVNRITEESTWHTAMGVPYNNDWVREFPDEIRSVLLMHAGAENQDRISVTTTESCPFLGLLRFDDRLFVFPYGAPSMRGGSESPWIELDRSETGGYLNRFAGQVLDYYLNELATSRAQSAGNQGATTS